jgi:iron(III) transport system permease protein
MTLLLLAALILWPVAAVLVYGLVSPGGWPLGLALTTLGVAAASTIAALVPAGLIAGALTRVDVPGRELIWHVVRLRLLIPPFIVPLALLFLAGGRRQSLAGLTAIVLAQGLAFLPHATALLVRALGGISLELEQAAEVLGASRLTVARRVTLRLAAPSLLGTVLVVLGLCLADVTAPLLLGGDRLVLASAVVAAAATVPGGAARLALVLGLLAAPVALAGYAWRYAGVAATGWSSLPRLDRPAPPAVRWPLGAVAWALTIGLAALWVLVPIASLGHWQGVAAGASLAALGNSALLGLGAAVAGTALALSAAWIVERRRTPLARVIDVLARVPIVVPGLVAGAGYALLFGRAPGAALVVLIPLLACWELPVTSRAARAVLVRSDRSVEDAALSLGAPRRTTLARIVAPTLRPVAGWIFADLFAGGVLAVGTVIVVAGSGLGALTMLTLAGAGSVGTACALATTLLALAGGARLLGRALAGP